MDFLKEDIEIVGVKAEEVVVNLLLNFLESLADCLLSSVSLSSFIVYPPLVSWTNVSAKCGNVR